MKKQDPLGRYPYVCPDCPELRPFKARVKYARHRAARHSVVVEIPGVETRGRPVVEPYDPDPAPIAALEAAYREPFDPGGLGHGTGALPTLDGYDERAR